MSLPAHVALDTNCFIYYFEDSHSRRAVFLHQEVFGVLQTGDRTASTSSLAIAELLARPYEQGRDPRARELRAAISGLPGLRTVPIDDDIADAAARMRGLHGVALADAVHLASAHACGADLFLTNDRRLQRPDLTLQVAILDDLL